jgi:hypothetical protein
MHLDAMIHRRHGKIVGRYDFDVVPELSQVFADGSHEWCCAITRIAGIGTGQYGNFHALILQPDCIRE